ncbi:type II toxin-antitoxin system VapB family antitoxin [Rathayibacter soli]|uniref:type II toxin-antitoxin system VapB family antitoxin n=1 Tax=Rathayibacter soli TaxID=3144168 RepID=UPI0027E59509|nr:type II toxin-antitoxin system VapB family antitoxin [Glaciibacter superstes]
MPITSVDVDADILRQAKQAYGVRTNREAINLALQETVMRQRQLVAIEEIAAIELDESAEKVTYER